jgi:hypothetical protein
MMSKSERSQLEINIIKYRSLARRVMHDATRQRIHVLIAEMEQKLRENEE